MTCEHTRAVLRGEAPPTNIQPHLDGCSDCQRLSDELDAVDAMVGSLAIISPPTDLINATLDAVDQAFDQDFDASFRDLAPTPAPPSLQQETLQAVYAAMTAETAETAEHASEKVVDLARKRGRWRWVGALAVAAAVLLVVFPPGKAPERPGPMNEKGNGVRLPELSMKVSVSSDGQLARYRTDRRYTVGDVLYFRANADTPGQATLVRVDGQTAAVVHQQELVGNADEDLRLSNGKPLGWAIEPGEDAAAFALLAGKAPLSADVIEHALQGAAPEEACVAAAALEVSCELIVVEIDDVVRDDEVQP